MQPALTIESKDMPGFPGTVVYQIKGQTFELVQREITRLFNQVEELGGCAEFLNPKRQDGEYVASGYTFVEKTRV